MYLEVLKEKQSDIFKNYETPYYVYLSLTNLCNANCSFCDVRDNKIKKNNIDVKKTINELAKMGTKYIQFTGGGEPFINDDIFEYLEYCSSQNIKVVTISNGLNLNEEKIMKLAQHNVETMFFSIDSSNPETHNLLRRTKGLFEKATENINLIKKYMPNVTIILNHVINTLNIDAFKDFIKMKEYVNFDYINPIIIKDCEDLFPKPEQIEKYNSNIEEFYRLADSLDVKFLCKDINILDNEVDINGDRTENENLKCVYPSFCAFIDCPTGDVYPCDCSIHRDRELYRIGNLKEQTFTEIWNAPKRTILKEKLLNGELDCKKKCDEANCFFSDCYFKFRNED